MATEKGVNEKSQSLLFDYHQRTKHYFHRTAPGPGFLDWATQPEPFRFYHGAPLHRLSRRESDARETPDYDALYKGLSAEPVKAETIADLFYHSFALSAWKEIPGARWALRCNPSSGNLHPTEVYLLTGAVEGLSQVSTLYHYQPYQHGLEMRGELPDLDWPALIAPLPESTFLIGFTSIYWRESWKYGERALRYCLLDLGHALAALAYSAAVPGWRCALLPVVASNKLAPLLGVEGQSGPEAEHPDCLVAVFPEGNVPWSAVSEWQLDATMVGEIARSIRRDAPNRLSASHRPWPIIEAAADAMACERIKVTPPMRKNRDSPRVETNASARSISARWLIRNRRSVQKMDGASTMSRADFSRLMERLWRSDLPVASLGRESAVHLGVYVHRVEGMGPGLYFLARSRVGLDSFRKVTTETWRWQNVEGFPDDMPFYLLREGDARPVAKALSCHQDIASEGAFAISMLAEFEPRLGRSVWEYARLHMEAGALGQLLYLESEAAGLRGTGIGCFFDDPVHELFGLSDRTFQAIYHFTAGGGLEDQRLTSLEAYYYL
ncbi:MAG: SagB/ThcOx family dehydrogenase [Methylothermaceae bacterium]|nr:SagB/ThcOx family dehydrogenase [Methylothermaceae bacterium]